MPSERRKIGDLGESLVCKSLESRGVHVISRNYLRKWGELDIVAKKGNTLHFIEVKSVSREIEPLTKERVTHETGHRITYRPEENVNAWKMHKIARTIQSYLADHSLGEDSDWQFDVAIVFLDFNRKIGRIKWIRDIVL